ncbi:hypothetical protein PILCRDRAFT_820947 [Piloderma croceum F 1598]|uniref:Uncharacterized protein n=1 Tax=Piloderma croceum (strain F 1598) TaxID=765440 RepID=A0A0C3FBH0_PILCF|nr:hypothetical protein PILCRDRAFT_820947 [Piloderma croceum F 1598]
MVYLPLCRFSRNGTERLRLAEFEADTCERHDYSSVFSRTNTPKDWRHSLSPWYQPFQAFTAAANIWV